MIRQSLWIVSIGLAVAGAALSWNAQDEAPVKPRIADYPGSDWPMYRRDPSLTAVSPLRGGLAEAPEVAWSLDLGGPKVVAERVVVRDVTGDGQDEFLTLSADTVSCRDSRSQLLWKLDDFLNANVVDVRDFAGDGSRGVLLTTHLAGRTDTYMVAGRTGQAVHLWRDENNFGGQTRIGRLMPGVAGIQIAAAASGAMPLAPQGGPVRLVSFENGVEKPNFHVQQHVTGLFYAPLILFADLDGDGNQEMVVISHEQIWAFDPRTNRQSFHAGYGAAIRTYNATVAAVKLHPKDPCPALVMINPSLPGLKAVATDGKTFARELWRVVIGGKEDQYQRNVAVAPAGPGLVYDLANDGSYQVLASIRNERGDGKTRLVVFEAASGARLAELPEAEVLAVDDLDGDGKPEIVLRRDKTLSIIRWRERDFQPVWQDVDVHPVLRPLPSEGDVRLTCPGGAPRGVVTLWREAPNSPNFLLRFADGIRACRMRDSGLEKGNSVVQHEALGNLDTAKKSVEQLVWDGAKLATMLEGREVSRYVPPAPTTYLAPPPLVAELRGKRQILVRNAVGKYLAVSPSGKVDRVLIERLYDTPHILVDRDGVGPMVCDMDGDGANDIVATVAEERGRPACVIHDGHGKEMRRFDLLPGMTAISRGPTGSLGPGRGRWLLLKMTGKSANFADVQIVVAYDGRSGKQLWRRDHYGHYGKNPVQFVPHFPSAVLDYDGDGADDWVVCSENFYGIINVKDNKDLVGPVVLSDALAGHWTAYTFPSLALPRAGARPVLFHHNAYSMALVTDLEGRPLWHFGMSRDTASAWGQFVDLDGDGQRDVLHAQPDGLLRCFTFEHVVKCPICAANGLKGKESGLRWQLDLRRPISRMIAADVKGDGRMAVVFGGSDGKLHAVGERDGQPRQLWSLALGRRVGEPVLGKLEPFEGPSVLVAAEDGRLYCLRRR
jgi:hypothetical protein